MSDRIEDVLCALLFAAEKPLSANEIKKALKQAAEEHGADGTLTRVNLDEALEATSRALEQTPFQIKNVAGGYRLATRPEYDPWISGLGASRGKASKLSQPALETLAIVAYRQPISRAEIEAVRGVAVGGVLETLADRSLVQIAGRADVPGRPLLYETTSLFLEHFGLSDLDALPNVEELRRVPLPEPPDADAPHQEELIEVEPEAPQPKTDGEATGYSQAD